MLSPKKIYSKGVYSVEDKLRKEFPDIAPKDISRIIKGFWNKRFGIAKYLSGFTSFSVNKLFFFVVNSNKEANTFEKEAKAIVKRKESMAKYDRKRKKQKQINPSHCKSVPFCKTHIYCENYICKHDTRRKNKKE